MLNSVSNYYVSATNIFSDVWCQKKTVYIVYANSSSRINYDCLLLLYVLWLLEKDNLCQKTSIHFAVTNKSGHLTDVVSDSKSKKGIK